ncbi:hypothetical protein PCANC_17368 [Puccinia coronata f. sp. avenae]|uniref:Uncharacterized protein n=1 Tax=Puccinia coronata f. sp. avenae TaxID=200324 RepID=A0A2N5U4T3_9BASI|nr:hypothetical protein PCANC_17368 [Puccinia coronata f. sp. avenae]
MPEAHGQKYFWNSCGVCRVTTSKQVQHPYCLLHTAEENRVPADTLEHAQGCLAIDHPQTVFEPAEEHVVFKLPQTNTQST